MQVVCKTFTCGIDKNNAGHTLYKTGCLALLDGHVLVNAYPSSQELNSLKPIDLMLKEVKRLFSSMLSINKHSCH